MEKATGGKIKVNIYAADQLTNGNQSEGIQALMNGDPVKKFFPVTDCTAWVSQRTASVS